MLTAIKVAILVLVAIVGTFWAYAMFDDDFPTFVEERGKTNIVISYLIQNIAIFAACFIVESALLGIYSLFTRY